MAASHSDWMFLNGGSLERIGEERSATLDPTLAERRRAATGGAEGMWSSDDPLSLLDTNEGYAPRLIGSPETIVDRLGAFRDLGIEMLHFDTRDELFNEVVLPELR